MMRRLAAFVSVLLLLNVSAAEALRVCESAADHANASAPVASEHAHHQPAPAEAPDESCETPASTECCTALSSCGASLVIDGADDDASVMPDRETSVRISDRAPASQVWAPDPPPPKA